MNSLPAGQADRRNTASSAPAAGENRKARNRTGEMSSSAALNRTKVAAPDQGVQDERCLGRAAGVHLAAILEFSAGELRKS